MHLFQGSNIVKSAQSIHLLCIGLLILGLATKERSKTVTYLQNKTHHVQNMSSVQPCIVPFRLLGRHKHSLHGFQKTFLIDSDDVIFSLPGCWCRKGSGCSRISQQCDTAQMKVEDVEPRLLDATLAAQDSTSRCVTRAESWWPGTRVWDWPVGPRTKNAGTSLSF